MCCQGPMKNSVHQALEGLGSILQTKGHPQKLKEPKWSNDGSLGDVFGHHRDLVVASHQVHLGEYSHASKVSREILNVRYWVPVRYRGIIEAPIVFTRTPAPRSFGYHV